MFPNFESSEHRITSEKDSTYNCVAWALGESDRWWEPPPSYYWPMPYTEGEAPSVVDVVAMFESLGYEQCGSNFELGYDYVAIYGDRDWFTHVARRLEDGRWASKLGDWEDIEHNELIALDGGSYGSVAYYLRRSAT